MAGEDKELRLELGVTEMEAIKRVVRTRDFEIGFEAYLNGLKQLAISKLSIADTERDLFRAQGELSRLKIIFDFVRKCRTTDLQKGQ